MYVAARNTDALPSLPHLFAGETEIWFGNSDIFPQTLKGANNGKTPTKIGVTYVKIHLKIPPVQSYIEALKSF